MLVLEHFNLSTSNATLSTFIENNGLNIQYDKKATCFKSATVRCIDLILTNRKHSFKETQTIETGFSDFHHMIFTILNYNIISCLPRKYSIGTTVSFLRKTFCLNSLQSLQKTVLTISRLSYVFSIKPWTNLPLTKPLLSE